MRLQIDALGERVVSRELLRMGGRAIDVSPAMDDVADILRRSMVAQFNTEGRHGGVPWRPPGEAWTRRKAELGLDTRTEQATLSMRESLTNEGGDHVAIPSRGGLDFGSTNPHIGYALKRGQKLVQPTERERREIVRTVQRYVVAQGAHRRGSGILAGSL